MSDGGQPSAAGWPGRVAVAVLRSDPPVLFLAEGADLLSRLVALRLVATTPSIEIDGSALTGIRARAARGVLG